MSNRILLRLLSLCGVSFMVLAFQNCSPNLTMNMNEGETVLSSQVGLTLPPELQKTTFEPVLMDRYVLRAFMTDVFGPSAETLPSFALLNNPIEYGSPCSVYENYLYQDAAGRSLNANSLETCALGSANFNSAGVNPKASVTRQAELPRLCSDIVHTDATYNVAMSKIRSGAPAVPNLDDQHLISAFHLFYREKPAPPESLLDALKLMAISDKAVTKADWQNVLYTICASGHWQVL